MHIQIEHHSGVPVYRQIMEQVAIMIDSGLLKPGESLPSVKELSGRLSVNPMTVSKAMSFLEHEGLVARQPGRPLVVQERKADEKEKGREFHMMNALRPAVRLANQLGYSKGEALDLYRELLEDEENEHS